MALLKPPYQYVIDSSALFDLKDFYPERIFRGLWERFNEMCEQQLIIAPREVLREIKRGNDELVDWANDHAGIFLEPCDEEQLLNQKILAVYPEKEIIKYSTRPWADPLVIACAKYYGLVVIQHESTDPNQFKIPPVAKKFDVNCIRLIEFFDEQNWAFP